MIEMLVVLAIVALLLTMAMPRYFGSLRKSKDTVLQQSLQVLRSGIDKFHEDKGRYPHDLMELVESEYLRAVPKDPVTESTSTWVLSPAPLEGVYDVHSGAPGSASDGTPYAQY